MTTQNVQGECKKMNALLNGLKYIDGYQLFDALKNGEPVSFTVGADPTEYTAQFHGRKVGGDNWLEVSNGVETQRWGWGWSGEQVFHCLHDLEHGRFENPFFKYRPATEPGEDGDW